jgi:hypothetical protein
MFYLALEWHTAHPFDGQHHDKQLPWRWEEPAALGYIRIHVVIIPKNRQMEEGFCSAAEHFFAETRKPGIPNSLQNARLQGVEPFTVKGLLARPLGCQFLPGFFRSRKIFSDFPKIISGNYSI